MDSGDTARRSLEHWSEWGLREMEKFYALATEDYRQLALAADWAALLGERAHQGWSLLDVACGSGYSTAVLAQLAHSVTALEDDPVLAARARAISEYSALVGEQGRLVHRRWILRETVPDTPLLNAPEIGPVADAAAMHDAVWRMRIAPISMRSMMRILVLVALPFIVVAGLQIPLKDLLLKLLKALA